MKKAFLLFVVPALLVTLGFAQTPAPSVNPDQTTIKGCLGGSDPNYTVVEDNTGDIFKITTSSVDLKPHLGHDVTLTGNKPGATNSTPPDNSLAVTALNMISEHCAGEAAAPAAIVAAPSETAGTPAGDTTPPAAPVTTPAETASTPAVVDTPPAVVDTPPAEIAVTPAPAADVPVAIISTPAATVAAPAARPRKRSETPAAAATTPAAIASTPAATAVVPVPTDTSSPAPVSTPAPVATTPTPTPASKGWSLWLLIAFGVLVIVMGVMFPFVNRWRKQRTLEQTGAPNLSFNREASSAGNESGQRKPNQGKGDEQQPRKAA